MSIKTQYTDRPVHMVCCDRRYATIAETLNHSCGHQASRELAQRCFAIMSPAHQALIVLEDHMEALTMDKACTFKALQLNEAHKEALYMERHIQYPGEYQTASSILAMVGRPISRRFTS